MRVKISPHLGKFPTPNASNIEKKANTNPDLLNF